MKDKNKKKNLVLKKETISNLEGLKVHYMGKVIGGSDGVESCACKTEHWTCRNAGTGLCCR